MTTVLVLNGPNLDRLGERQPEIYGTTTLTDLERMLAERADALDATIEFHQSPDADVLVDLVEHTRADAIVINPASLTHHSLALREALAACGRPVYEVHISNIHAREPYRRRSMVSGVARGVVAGLGVHGYLAALEAAIREARA